MWSLATTFVLGIIASIIAAMIIGGKEKALRSWLSRRGVGLLQRFYISLFVSAVRGSSRVTYTRHLVLLYILVLTAFSTAFGFSLSYYERTVTTVLRAGEEQDKEMDAVLQKAVKVLQGDHAEIKPSSADLREQVSKLRDFIAEGRLLRDELSQVVSIIRTLQKIFEVCFLPLLLWMSLWYYPRCVLETSISVDIERLSLRLQGLASKAELAELTRRELAVRDRETARLYVRAVHAIADRFSLQSLYNYFPFFSEFPLQEIPETFDTSTPMSE